MIAAALCNRVGVMVLLVLTQHCHVTSESERSKAEGPQKPPEQEQQEE